MQRSECASDAECDWNCNRESASDAERDGDRNCSRESVNDGDCNRDC